MYNMYSPTVNRIEVIILNFEFTIYLLAVLFHNY